MAISTLLFLMVRPSWLNVKPVDVVTLSTPPTNSY
nr:MAG TPA: hypothetical protein [Caudoviricetes sp.]